MINVTKAYRDATKKPIRQSYVTIKYGLFNKEAKQELSRISFNGKQPFSSVSNTTNETKENVYNYISCEPNRVKLDNNFVFIEDKKRENNNQDAGYWSNELSNENGTFTDVPYISYELSNQISFTHLTLYFQEVVKDINIKYYLNNILLHTIEVRNNNKLIIYTSDVSSEKPQISFNKVQLEFVATQKPFRYIKFNEIDFGSYKVFKPQEIENFNIIEEIDLFDDNLPSNSLDITIRDDYGKYDILNPKSNIKGLQEGQELSAYHYLKVGTMFREVCLGTFLLKKVTSENRKLKLECYDELYFMNSTYYGSKFYRNERASVIFKDLFDYFNYSSSKYNIDPKLDEVTLTGYVPEVSFREALRLIAESCKAIIKKRRTGGIYIYIDDKENQGIANYFYKSDYSNEHVKENLYNNTVDVTVYSYENIQDANERGALYSSTLNEGEYNISFTHKPLVYSEYIDMPEKLIDEQGDFDILSINANGCRIRVYSNNVLVSLSGKYYIENSTHEIIKLNKNTIVDESAIKKIDNHLIGNNNYKEIASWKLNRSNAVFELKYKTTPFIETGDKCKIDSGYKDVYSNIISRDFTVTKVEYDETIYQEIKGE